MIDLEGYFSIKLSFATASGKSHGQDFDFSPLFNIFYLFTLYMT